MEANLPDHIFLILLCGAFLILFCPRSWVLGVLLVLTGFVSTQFHLFIFDLNFYPARILLLVAWMRVLAKGEHREFQMRPMDRAFVAFCLSMVLAETLRRGGPGFIYSVANSVYDSLGIYFLGRVCIREAGQIRQVIGWLAVICCVFAGFMLVERLTRRNLLMALGAVIEEVQARDGKLRCQATFAHPVLAGTYGGVLLPIFLACWWQGPKMKRIGVLGSIASLLMVVTSGSSGPIMTFLAVLFGLFMWPMRFRMRRIRWAVLISLVGLHLVMKAPVWALIGRASSLTGGGSGYHRFNLLDEYINHVGDWWLMGIDKTDWGWLTDDVANEYCIIAKHGGLLALVLFIRFLAAGFREVGIARSEAEGDWPTAILVWAFGACLFGHLATFFGTSYFDQTSVLWYVTLAMIASLHLLPNVQPDVVEVSHEEEEIVESPEVNPQGIALG